MGGDICLVGGAPPPLYIIHAHTHIHISTPTNTTTQVGIWLRDPDVSREEMQRRLVETFPEFAVAAAAAADDDDGAAPQ